MDTVQWIKILDNAFEKEDVGALNKVIGLLRAKLDEGAPAAASAVPNAHVPAPANEARAEHPAPPAPLPLPLNAAPPSEPFYRAVLDSLPPPSKRPREKQ